MNIGATSAKHVEKLGDYPMATSRFLWIKAGGALPWLALALLITIAAWINSIINLGCLSPDPDCLSYDMARLIPENVVAAMTADLESVTRHLLARINWALASIGFPIAAAAALVVAFNVGWACFRELTGREKIFGGLLMLGGVVLVMGVVLLCTRVFGPDVLSEPKVTSELRAATLHKTLMTEAVSVDKEFDKLAYATFLLLTSAATATLLWPATVTSQVLLLRRRIARALVTLCRRGRVGIQGVGNVLPLPVARGVAGRSAGDFCGSDRAGGEHGLRLLLHGDFGEPISANRFGTDSARHRAG
jgi:hypothetical protein